MVAVAVVVNVTVAAANVTTEVVLVSPALFVKPFCASAAYSRRLIVAVDADHDILAGHELDIGGASNEGKQTPSSQPNRHVHTAMPFEFFWFPQVTSLHCLQCSLVSITYHYLHLGECSKLTLCYHRYRHVQLVAT